MKIGIDFDGVVADAAQLKSRVAKSLYDKEIPPKKFKREIIIGEGLLTTDQYQNIQKTIYENRDISLQMEPVDGMLQYIPRLHSEGHVIQVISSRHGNSIGYARDWLKKYKVMLDFVGVGPNAEKTTAANGLDIFIDDDLDKLIPLKRVVPNLFLFSRSYNEHINPAGVAVRVTSWADLYQRIGKISVNHIQ